MLMDVLRTTWILAAKDLLQLTKDRASLVWLIALPLLLMSLLGSLVSSVTSNAGSITATLPVITQDGGPGAAALLAALRQTPSLKVEMRANIQTEEKQVRLGNEVGLLIIPRGFSAALATAHPAARVTYYTVPGNADLHATVASYSVQAVVQHLAWTTIISNAVTQAQEHGGGHANPALTSQIAAQASRQLAAAPPVAIQTINATGRQTYGQDQTVPGYALMFALFGISAAAGSLLEEKESGTLKRLLIAPIPPLALLGGKALALFIQSLAQLSLLFVLGVLFFKIDVGASPLALALLIVGTSLAATGLGMILVSFVTSQRQLRPLTTLVTLGFSAIGGSWFPISLEPQWLQNLSKISLNGWAMSGFNGLMLFEKGFMDVLPDILVLFAYGIVCFIVATRLFQFRTV
jgi:ABC-2 type transport system permease protein